MNEATKKLVARAARAAAADARRAGLDIHNHTADRFAADAWRLVDTTGWQPDVRERARSYFETIFLREIDE